MARILPLEPEVCCVENQSIQPPCGQLESIHSGGLEVLKWHFCSEMYFIKTTFSNYLKNVPPNSISGYIEKWIFDELGKVESGCSPEVMDIRFHWAEKIMQNHYEYSRGGLIVPVSHMVNVISLLSLKCIHWCPDERKYQIFGKNLRLRPNIWIFRKL